MTFKMRFVFGACSVFAIALAGCGGDKEATPAPTTVSTVPPAQAALASKIRVGDPTAASQLGKGFYGIENGWRWTGSHFSVILKVPAGASASGGTLTFGFTTAGPVMNKVKSQTLTASVGGKALAPQTYTTAGNQTYTADVPADALGGDTVTVDFALDKFLPPSPADGRELGVIATSVGLTSK